MSRDMGTSIKKRNRVHGEGIELEEGYEWDPEVWQVWCCKSGSLTLNILGNGKEDNNKKDGSKGCRSSSK